MTAVPGCLIVEDTSTSPIGDTRWGVQCAAHGLNRLGLTARHAINLEAQHLRQWHADTPHALDIEVDLSGPASLAAMAYTLPAGNELAGGFIAMWENLVGRMGRPAEELAKAIQASPRPVRAAVVPL
jgi:hypothetical protein